MLALRLRVLVRNRGGNAKIEAQEYYAISCAISTLV